MKTKQKNPAVPNRIQSKIDHSGTDPNRYGGYYSADDAEKLATAQTRQKDSLIPGIPENVSTLERFLMVAAGSYLMYDALARKNKKIGQSMAAGAMLARGISGYCPVYDLTSNKGGFLASGNINVRSSVTIDRPVSEVYSFWRDFENLPQFLKHLKSVSNIDKNTSRWTVSGPGGIGSLSWNAQLLMDEPNQMISWHSMPDSVIDNAGKIQFKSVGENQTEIDLTLSYRAPLGKAGETVAKWLSPVFAKMVERDIQGIKSRFEGNPN